MADTSPEAPFVPEVDPVIKSLLPGYVENRRKEPAKLEAALAAGDYTLLRKMGHDLKGSGGAYGFPPISVFGGEIEQAALASDGERIRAAIAGLAAFLGRVKLPD